MRQDELSFYYLNLPDELKDALSTQLTALITPSKSNDPFENGFNDAIKDLSALLNETLDDRDVFEGRVSKAGFRVKYPSIALRFPKIAYLKDILCQSFLFSQKAALEEALDTIAKNLTQEQCALFHRGIAELAKHAICHCHYYHESSITGQDRRYLFYAGKTTLLNKCHKHIGAIMLQ